ncbi:MAG: flagellar hook capping protein [Candidatus Lambdaproteobacteria bacterium]|nr:flagellar hook capping protein [Candidatus Lambdaproteobacteria bacterium]
MDVRANTETALRQAGTSLANATSAPAPGGKDKLGKDDFLKLLMAQVTHQDPLNPMDSQGMMNQLTQMGALEQMVNLNAGVGKLNEVQADIARSSAYTFLDKDVAVRGGGASVEAGTPTTPVIFELPSEAEQVQVNVLDTQGQPVRRLELGRYAAGNHEVRWDGKDDAGMPVADGNYRYEVSATAGDAAPLTVDMFSRGKVAGVRFSNGRSLIKVNGREVDIRDVVELSNQSQRLFGERKPLPLQQNFRLMPPIKEPQR